MTSIIEALRGQKTFIIAALGIGFCLAYFLGFITREDLEIVLTILGFGGLAALRAGMNNAVKKA